MSDYELLSVALSEMLKVGYIIGVSKNIAITSGPALSHYTVVILLDWNRILRAHSRKQLHLTQHFDSDDP